MSSSPILERFALTMPWPGLDPFLMTMHHNDAYPEGNEQQGPAAPLTGRQLGMDFSYMGGWSMYHGDVVPGFPQHPHRGFETVTVVRRGYVDHSDSLGATARYGQGDVQWLTTGGGIQHAEMFPLVDAEQPNPLELFQIWLNLPPESKMVDAYFAMLWSEDIPVVLGDGGVEIVVMCGQLDGEAAPPAPPDSWASAVGSDMAIWLITMPAGSSWTVPASGEGLNRALYFFEGHSAKVADTTVDAGTGLRVASNESVALESVGGDAKFLLLQGRPIGAPVIQLGPFVMNTSDEVHQALADYRATGFGGWPWSGPAPVHDREMGRFAVHADGEIEYRDRPVQTVPGSARQ